MTVPAAIADNLLRKAGEFPSSPAYKIVMPLEKYEPTDGEIYIDTLHLPNVPPVGSIAGGVRNPHIGLLQMTVVGPLDRGEIPLSEVAGDIIAFFEQGTRIDGNGVRVKINRQPYVSPALKDGAWLRLPVTIPYVCSA